MKIIGVVVGFGEAVVFERGWDGLLGAVVRGGIAYFVEPFLVDDGIKLAHAGVLDILFY